MPKIPLIENFQNALLSILVLLLLTSKSTAASIIIEEFSLTESSDLAGALTSLTQKIQASNGKRIQIDFKDPDLAKTPLPKLQVRRVFLVDILTALSSLSVTEIVYQNQKITITRAKAVVSATPATNTPSDLEFHSGKSTPLDTDQPIVQLYNLGSYLRAESAVGTEVLLSQLRKNLDQTMEFRGDLSTKFEFHYIQTAQAVYLKAPIQFHLNLTNQLAGLPTEKTEPSYQLAANPPRQEPTSPTLTAGSPKSDLAILITAIQELSSQVETLRTHVERQQLTIAKISKTSSPRSE